ncbi:MAG: hypothetical protein ABJA20_09595 [Novosphingobium sp.]
MRGSAWVAIVLGAMLVPATAHTAEQTSSRHEFPISIANPAPADALRNGPIFKRLNAASYLAKGTVLIDLFDENAVIHVQYKNQNFKTYDERRKFLLTLLHDCQGPYAVDEGKEWVQTSWVCHVANDRPIRAYFDFKDSPEISLEFRFANGNFGDVFAFETIPVPVPGKSKYLPMNAAETVPDKR